VFHSATHRIVTTRLFSLLLTYIPKISNRKQNYNGSHQKTKSVQVKIDITNHFHIKKPVLNQELHHILFRMLFCQRLFNNSVRLRNTTTIKKKFCYFYCKITSWVMSKFEHKMNPLSWIIFYNIFYIQHNQSHGIPF
jgi:hypothetical protein